MKNITSFILPLLLAVTTTVIAKSNSSSSSEPPPPAHHSSSAPVTPPGGSSVSHNSVGSFASHNFPGSNSYRSTTTINANGQRTLVYPGVHNSIIRQSAKLNPNAPNPGLKQQGLGRLHGPSGIATITKTKLDPQTSTRLHNWNGNRSTTVQARQLNAMNHHHHHDHDWWKHHCVTFIFFDWGWWGWYDGWWYPAWGYDPYSNYEYNEPIYGDLAPDQIVAGVQTKLQQLGYYTYAIDGKMGPLTQSAIASYQRDHRMSITSGIDQPTLVSLGIIR